MKAEMKMRSFLVINRLSQGALWLHIALYIDLFMVRESWAMRMLYLICIIYINSTCLFQKYFYDGIIKIIYRVWFDIASTLRIFDIFLNFLKYWNLHIQTIFRSNSVFSVIHTKVVLMNTAASNSELRN